MQNRTKIVVAVLEINVQQPASMMIFAMQVARPCSHASKSIIRSHFQLNNQDIKKDPKGPNF